MVGVTTSPLRGCGLDPRPRITRDFKNVTCFLLVWHLACKNGVGKLKMSRYGVGQSNMSGYGVGQLNIFG